jgi:inorganic triphosphatase YgiF
VITVDAKLDLAEIEIELKHGNRRDAAQLANKLARGGALTLSVGSKAERGYALLEGHWMPLSLPNVSRLRKRPQ